VKRLFVVTSRHGLRLSKQARALCSVSGKTSFHNQQRFFLSYTQPFFRSGSISNQTSFSMRRTRAVFGCFLFAILFFGCQREVGYYGNADDTP
jgi:hypothetical protein